MAIFILVTFTSIHASHFSPPISTYVNWRPLPAGASVERGEDPGDGGERRMTEGDGGRRKQKGGEERHGGEDQSRN